MKKSYDFRIDSDEYSDSLDSKRKKMCEVSYYKYGSARDNFGSGRVDAVKTAEMCIERFKKDRNLERLADAMNYLMFQCMYPYPNDYWESTDSDGSVGTVGTPINMEKD